MKRAMLAGALAVAVLVVLSACGGKEEQAAAPAQAAPDSAKLAIVHVQRGCHVWSKGQKQAVTMRLRVGEDGTLTVVNNDIDVHRLVQTAGPALALGSPMMMGAKMAVVFPEPGLYRLRTEVVEVEGMDEMMELETEGPDNELELEIEVS